MDGADITVQSPRNIQQCRSHVYEYGIVNNVKNSECSVSINCGKLHGGSCKYHSYGGYHLHLELRHAWSAKTPTSRGSERICENKKYERTLVHNDMVMLKMTLHDDPQDRFPDEKFTCSVKRTCSTLKAAKYNTKATFAPKYPSIASLTSEHQKTVSDKFLFSTTSTPGDPIAYYLSRINLQGTIPFTLKYDNQSQVEHKINNTNMSTLSFVPFLSSTTNFETFNSESITFSTQSETKHATLLANNLSSVERGNHAEDNFLYNQSITEYYEVTPSYNSSMTFLLPPTLNVLDFSSHSQTKQSHFIAINSSSAKDEGEYEDSSLDIEFTKSYNDLDIASFATRIPTTESILSKESASLNDAIDVTTRTDIFTTETAQKTSISLLNAIISVKQKDYDKNGKFTTMQTNSYNFPPSHNNQMTSFQPIDSTTSNIFSSNLTTKLSTNSERILITTTINNKTPFPKEINSNQTQSFSTQVSNLLDQTLSCTKILNALKSITKELVALFNP